ncbi:hypothetical protein B0T22DRAFT_73696 [Podospora appendiculata]|uniref:Uncharacterized protein n=1 Tax=Podospora appendiculata TaxID=314037 RepID=A0AAE0XJN8_9PEZI|nr:hypothetical protein B0T22DRAFT_73696 [Podospora appendiculata]
MRRVSLSGFHFRFHFHFHFHFPCSIHPDIPRISRLGANPIRHFRKLTHLRLPTPAAQGSRSRTTSRAWLPFVALTFSALAWRPLKHCPLLTPVLLQSSDWAGPDLDLDPDLLLHHWLATFAQKTSTAHHPPPVSNLELTRLPSQVRPQQVLSEGLDSLYACNRDSRLLRIPVAFYRQLVDKKGLVAIRSGSRCP